MRGMCAVAQRRAWRAALAANAHERVNLAVELLQVDDVACARAGRREKHARVSLGASEPRFAPNEAHIAPPRRLEGASIALSSRGAGGGRREAKKLRSERARQSAWPHRAAQRTLDGSGHVAAQQHGAGELGDDGYAPGAPEGERARRAARGERVGCVARSSVSARLRSLCKAAAAALQS